MPALFDRYGISFAYPENWSLDDSEDGIPFPCVTVSSPQTAFWSLSIHSRYVNMEELIETAIEALRLGVSELLIKPFDMADMAAVVQEAGQRQRKRHHHRVRYRRLRRMASRIICERRDLRQRMDLICQDLVHAYRGLAQKVAASGLLVHEPGETT